ncbi:unnamed protein product, partial [Mesorhabditis spiculigera]
MQKHRMCQYGKLIQKGKSASTNNPLEIKWSTEQQKCNWTPNVAAGLPEWMVVAILLVNTAVYVQQKAAFGMSAPFMKNIGNGNGNQHALPGTTGGQRDRRTAAHPFNDDIWMQESVDRVCACSGRRFDRGQPEGGEAGKKSGVKAFILELTASICKHLNRIRPGNDDPPISPMQDEADQASPTHQNPTFQPRLSSADGHVPSLDSMLSASEWLLFSIRLILWPLPSPTELVAVSNRPPASSVDDDR